MAALHATAHAHIDIVPDICTLISTFARLKGWIIEGLDNRGWTVFDTLRSLFLVGIKFSDFSE